MKLDLQKPVFVMLGAWNPAIFQPGWIAHFLFDVPVGDNVEMTTLIASSPEPGLIYYLKGVGVGVTAQRLSIFASSDSDSSLSLAESVLISTIKALSHTPLGPYGINFAFVEADPSADLKRQLGERGGLERKFKVTSQKFTATVELDDGHVLNVMRFWEPNAAGIEFNYHFSKLEIPDVDASIRGSAVSRLGHAKQILREIYSLECSGILKHEVPPPNAETKK